MEQTEKPKFSWRWYHFLIIAAGLLLSVCIGGTVFLVNTPQFRDALQGAGQSLGELTRLQSEIAEEFELVPAQVGVFINFATTTSNGKTQNVRSLTVNLTNTPIGDLTGAERTRKLNEIAKFAHDHYAAADQVNQFCVVLVRSSQVGVFSSKQTENQCFSSGELGSD